MGRDHLITMDKPKLLLYLLDLETEVEVTENQIMFFATSSLVGRTDNITYPEGIYLQISGDILTQSHSQPEPQETCYSHIYMSEIVILISNIY